MKSPRFQSAIPADALAQAVDLLRAEPAVCAAFLHGSVAQGAARPGSDVDIAVLLFPKQLVSPAERLQLAADLEAVLGRPADLGVLSSRNLVYAREVIEHGQRLFAKDVFFTERFLATCLSLYAALQEDRQEVLRAYTVA